MNVIVSLNLAYHLTCHLCLRSTTHDCIVMQARLLWAKVLRRVLFGYNVLVNRFVLIATVHHTYTKVWRLIPCLVKSFA